MKRGLLFNVSAIAGTPSACNLGLSVAFLAATVGRAILFLSLRGESLR